MNKSTVGVGLGVGVGCTVAVGEGVGLGVGAGVGVILGDAVGDALALELAIGVGEGLMLCEAWVIGLASSEAEGDGVAPICPVLGVVLGACDGAAVWLCCCADGPLSGVFSRPGGAMSVHPASVTVVNEQKTRLFMFLSQGQ